MTSDDDYSTETDISTEYAGSFPQRITVMITKQWYTEACESILDILRQTNLCCTEECFT